MAVMYDKLGQLDKAIEEYKKALKTEENNSFIHLNLAASFIKNNNFEKAIEELKISIALEPEAVEPHAILALLYSLEKKTDLAVSEYEMALKNAAKLDPKNIEIYKSLAAVYLQQKKLGAARDIYQLVLKLSPADAEAHFYLANIYADLKDSLLAEKEIKQALGLKPDFHEALNFLGYLYVEENRNLDQAEIMIKRALQMEPNSGAYTDSLGWLYFKQGKIREALKELEKASSLSEDPVIYDHLGEAYFKTGDIERARLNWQQSLKLDAQQDQVKQKIEKLNNTKNAVQ